MIINSLTASYLSSIDKIRRSFPDIPAAELPPRGILCFELSNVFNQRIHNSRSDPDKPDYRKERLKVLKTDKFSDLPLGADTFEKVGIE